MRKWSRYLFSFILLIGIFAPIGLPDYYVQLTTRGLILSITAMSFILLAGYGGLTSMVQMSIFAVGGYLIGICVMTYGWPYWVAVIMAISASILVSALFAIICARSDGIYFLMITLALSQVTYGIAMQWSSVTRGSEGFSGILRPNLLGFHLLEYVPLYYLALFVTLIIYLLLKRFVSSPFGLALQGVRDNPTRMAALGFNIKVIRFFTFVISGAVAGIAGIIGVIYYGGVSPTTTGFSQILLVVLASIIGGVSAIEGGIIGGIITVFIMSFTSQLTQRYMTINGLIFVLVILFLPNGIHGSLSTLRKTLIFNFQKIKSIIWKE